MSEEDRIRNLMMLDYSQLIMYASSLEELNDINHKEIERLKEDNEYLNKVNIELSTEKNRLNNIIKEVIEYIENNSQYDDNVDNYWTTTNELLEILDKENK